MTPPPVFSNLTHLSGPNASKIPPITASTFTARQSENTPPINRTSTSNNLDPMINPNFVEANYEVLKSLLREHRRQRRNEDLRTELEYRSEEYDEEREMEPRPMRVREAIPILQAASSRIQRQKERVAEIEDAPNREGSRVERNDKGGRYLGQRIEDNGSQGMNLPPLLAAHLGRNENGQPLQSSLTSMHGGRHPSTNIGGNIPPNEATCGKPMSHPSQDQGAAPPSEDLPPITPIEDMLRRPSRGAASSYLTGLCTPRDPSGVFADYTGCVIPFVSWIEDYPLPDGLKMPSHVRSYDGKGDPNNFLHLFEGAIRMQKWAMSMCITSSRRKEKALELSLLDRRSREIRITFPYGVRNQEGQKKVLDTQHGDRKKENKETTPVEAPILMISRQDQTQKRKSAKEPINRLREITFPPVSGTNNSSDPVIIKACIYGREVNQSRLTGSAVAFSGEHFWPLGEVPLKITIGDGSLTRTEVLNFVIIRSNSPHNLLLGRTAMQRIGIVVSIIYGAIKFHTPKGIGTMPLTYKPLERDKRKKKSKATCPKIAKNVLSCGDAKERIIELLIAIVDIFVWTYADMTGILRTIMVGGKSFNTEHKLNEYKHIKPIKQKKRGLGSDRNEATCREVEELPKAGILRKVKNQTWVANPVMVKKSNEKWRMCVDFTDINKSCPKDGYPLPNIDWKVESLLRFRLKYFLDAYKGYHQIQMAKDDEDKTAFFACKEVFCYRKMPFGLKNARATYQRLVDKVFGDQIGRNLKAYVDDMVIKSTFEEDIRLVFRTFHYKARNNGQPIEGKGSDQSRATKNTQRDTEPQWKASNT
ncbi:reverse transcriptase domain-containing protein [Tanacetum coccineum]